MAAGDKSDGKTCFSQGWYCPSCGVGRLQDIRDYVDKGGGAIERLVFDITKSSIRYWCPDCATIFGDGELKDHVLRT